MEKLLFKLQSQARAHPANPVLRRILSDFRFLLNGDRLDSPQVKSKFDELQHDLGMLATEGLWEPSQEEEESLRDLRRRLHITPEENDDVPLVDESPNGIQTNHVSSFPEDLTKPARDDSKRSGRDISIVQPPPLSSPLLPVSTLTPTVLPIELVQTLNHTFFLHLLANDPERVLPPGKSLLSMMSAPRTNAQTKSGELPKLEERIKDIVHTTFWEEALESLSNPSPDKQLPRLRRLYEDLLAAAEPLLPRNHPILITLSSPLSPTSSPLRSVIVHLREVLVSLRERCSPARDAQIDHLIQTLNEPNQLASTEELAEVVADTARSILELTELMKEDLSQFVLGSTDEKDLRIMVTQQAMLREKALILQLWPPSRVEPAWKTWLGELDTSVDSASETVQPLHRRWTYRLVQALGANSPVTCPLPTIRIPGTDTPKPAEDERHHERERPPNILPPPFFVTWPALLAAQNYLQALVIAASLRSLVRLPARSSPVSSAEDGPASFTQRIWSLLKASVDEEPGAEDTKIVNLADEVVRVRRACADPAHPCSPDEEARLRATVARTLQPRDPVFLLLQKRLLQGLAAWLVSAPTPQDPADGGRASAPIHMQTGRERPGKRSRLHLGLDSPKSVFVGWERERGKPPVTKGFEDEALVREVGETFRRVGKVVDWTDRIWQDLVETGEIGGSVSDASADSGDAAGGMRGESDRRAA